MSTRIRALSSTVGTKLLLGVTGLALFIYLLIHIAGNVIVFAGPAAFNRYAFVMEYGNPLLPVIEIGLLLVFLLHIYKAITNYLANTAARPVSYVKKERAGWPSRKSFASSTMIFSGLWLILFLVIHVKTFRFTPTTDWPAGGRDLYHLELGVFTNPVIVAFYVLSMVVIGSHLWHGIASALQSLGLDHPRWTPRILAAGKVIAVLLAGAFIAIALWAHFIAGAQS